MPNEPIVGLVRNKAQLRITERSQLWFEHRPTEPVMPLRNEANLRTTEHAAACQTMNEMKKRSQPRFLSSALLPKEPNCGHDPVVCETKPKGPDGKRMMNQCEDAGGGADWMTRGAVSC